MSILRPYQDQAVTALREARMAAPDVTRLAVEMATGLGKTITFAAELDEFLDGFEGAGNRVLVLVHTDELVRQAVARIAFVTKGRWTIGVVKAARNEVDADVVVASVQTLAQPGRKEQITDVGKIIVDEAHHAVAPSYVSILRWYGGVPHHQYDDRPAIPVTGYSATLARTDGVGLGRVWQDLTFSRSLSWGIRHGYLIDFTPYTITIPGVEAGVSDSALDAMLADSIAPEAVVRAWTNHARSDDEFVIDPASYPSTVLFAPLVRSAEAFAAAFNAAGVKAEVVHGKMSKDAVAAVLDRYEAGITTVVCNAMKLTEGWDSPRTMCVIVARPTQSVNLFVQILGRGLRPWLDAEAPPRAEQRCVLLCVQGTTRDVATVADLSENIGQVQDGKSFLAMEDEYDLGRDIEPDEDNAWRGPVRVEAWDALVQASSKAWKFTEAGIPFLPTAKRSQGYVFIVQTNRGHEVWARRGLALGRLATAPDLELAMVEAEDQAQELGGDIGALLADKSRAWRKGVPSAEAMAEAQRLGLGKELIQIMEGRASGKAGKLSDLIDKVKATKALDHNAVKIKERGNA